MISKIDFIHKDNITAGTVAASYTNVYDFEYPEQKFNEDFQWFATSPSEIRFSLIFDAWIEDNVFDETHPTLKNIDGTPLSNDSGNKFNRHVVRVYEDDVLFFEGIVTVEDLDYSVNDQMIKIIVRDYLVLFTDIEKIEYDLTISSTTAVSRTLPNEPFLQEYAHDIYNLLRIIKATAEQQYFNPDYVKFNIEKDNAIVNKRGGTILFRNTWLWNDKVFSLSQFKNSHDDGWFQAEIRTFNAHTGIEQFGGIFNLPYSDYDGASAVEEAINNILFQSGMTDQTWQANYSYTADASVIPFVTRLYRLEKVEQPTGDYDEYRVYRNTINLNSDNYPVLINEVLDFNVKQQAPYEDPLVGTSTVVGITTRIDFKDYSFESFHLQEMGNGLDLVASYNSIYYEEDGEDLVVYYFKITNFITEINPVSTCALYQEKHIFNGFAEISSTTYVNAYSYTGIRQLEEWLTGGYTDITYNKFLASQIITRMDENSFGLPINIISGTVNFSSLTYAGNIKVGVNEYNIKANLTGNLFVQNGVYLKFSILYVGYAASRFLNYSETVNTPDVLKIITVLNNCSYYCKLNTFYVSDKDYVLDASSETILSSDIIELNKSRVWSAVIDEIIYDKLFVFDIKVFKKYVEDYYNLKFFAKVKQLISFKLSTIFNSTVINLGSRLSFLGKDYIVSSWKNIYENIFEITAFNDTLTVLQFSNDGVTFSDAELSNNGTLLNIWNVKEV